jgi:hypothetical protein
MWLRFAACSATLLFLTVTVRADDWAERAKLDGSWQAPAVGKDPGSVWTFQDKDTTLLVTETRNGEKLLEIDCNTEGKECSARRSGKTVKVSLFYNGPKLVEIETRGNDVVRRRFDASGTGGMLRIEVMPMSPPGKAETIELKRLTSSAK